jgi:hypothetical protein
MRLANFGYMGITPQELKQMQDRLAGKAGTRRAATPVIQRTLSPMVSKIRHSEGLVTE